MCYLRLLVIHFTIKLVQDLQPQSLNYQIKVNATSFHQAIQVPILRLISSILGRLTLNWLIALHHSQPIGMLLEASARTQG